LRRCSGISLKTSSNIRSRFNRGAFVQCAVLHGLLPALGDVLLEFLDERGVPLLGPLAEPIRYA